MFILFIFVHDQHLQAAATMPNTYILDFEAFQIGTHYFPVEIAIVNCNTYTFETFYVKHPCMKQTWNPTICFQHHRHGLKWDSPGISYLEEVRDLICEKILKDGDTVLVKGDQKLAYFRDEWFHMLENVKGIDIGGPVVYDARKRRCIIHSSMSDSKRCALQKCLTLYDLL